VLSPLPLLTVVLLLPALAQANPYLDDAQRALDAQNPAQALSALEKAESWQWRGEASQARTAVLKGLAFIALKRPVSAKKAFAEALAWDAAVTLPSGSAREAHEIFSLAQQESSAGAASVAGMTPLDLRDAASPAPPLSTRATLERPPARLRVDSETVSTGARFQPLLYWHQVSGGGQTHRTPMALAGVRLDAAVRTGPLRLSANYAFSWGGVFLTGRWVAAQVHDVTFSAAVPFSTRFLRQNSRGFVEAGYSGTLSSFGTHFPRHLSNDRLHRARVGAGWQTAFYLWDLEAQLELGAQVFPYARLYETPVVSGDQVAGWGAGTSGMLQLPLAGRVLGVVGADVRWTRLGATGVSTRPSFNLLPVTSVQQILVTGSAGVMLPF